MSFVRATSTHASALQSSPDEPLVHGEHRRIVGQRSDAAGRASQRFEPCPGRGFLASRGRTECVTRASLLSRPCSRPEEEDSEGV